MPRKRDNIPSDRKSALLTHLECRCANCGRMAHDVKDLVFGHIDPHSKGGTDKIGNLLPLCVRCNQANGTRYESIEWYDYFYKNYWNKPSIREILFEILNLMKPQVLNEVQEPTKPNIKEFNWTNRYWLCDCKRHHPGYVDSCTECKAIRDESRLSQPETESIRWPISNSIEPLYDHWSEFTP